MKVVINKCYGGFSISCAAIKRLAELQGRKCYFFKSDIMRDTFYSPTTDLNNWNVSAFDISNPNEIIMKSKNGQKMSDEERIEADKLYEEHKMDFRPDNRSDPLLIQVIEELGEKANGIHAQLAIVEIPAGTKYEIEGYDGREHIAEIHRTWS